MFKTYYAIEQYKGWWYALKCTTLFGITIWTEYINELGTNTYSGKGDSIYVLMGTEEAALNAIELYRSMLKYNKEFKEKNVKKRWVE